MTQGAAGAISTVAMLGLGDMGAGIAANIARRGFEVRGFDPSEAARTRAAEAGVRPCLNAAEAAAGADLLLAIPLNIGQVEQALFGPNGALETLRPPGPVVLMSTVGPDNAKALAIKLSERGYRLVDAPVSGGASGATEGTLTIMAAGSADDLERARPTLAAFTHNIFHVGSEVGLGQAVKLVNNHLAITHLVATVEALTLAARSGCDVSQIYDLISTSLGNSSIFHLRAPAILDRTFETGASMKVIEKDMGLILEAGRSAGMPMFLASTAAQVLEMTSALGFGDEDDVAIAKAYELITGQQITGPE